MIGDVELLYAIRDLENSQKLTPEIHLGYNAGDELIQIKKTVCGTEYLRIITDPDVVDTVVDRWVEYGEWTAV